MGRRSQRQHVGAGHIAHMDEVAALATVLKDAGGLTTAQGGEEQAGDPGIGRVFRATGPVDVVIAQGDHRDAALPTERGAQMLLVGLGGGVGVARVYWRRLGHRLGQEVSPATRAGRFEESGGQAVRRAGPGTRRPAPGAPVGAFAVDDHAPRHDQTPGEAGRVQGREEHRGAHVIVLDVVGDVGEAHAEPDPGRLMTDGVDTFEHVRPGVDVPHVCLHIRRLGIGIRRWATIDHHDLVARAHQRVDQMRADEPRPAGHENPHAQRPSRPSAGTAHCVGSRITDRG